MQRHKVDSGIERRVLIGLATSGPFLSQAEPALDLKAIESELFTTVARWCTDYFRQYGKAPGKHIEDLFHAWSSDNKETDLVDGVRDFLETLSGEYEAGTELNVPYLLDQLRDLLRRYKLKQLVRDLDYDIVRGDISRAEEAVTTYQSVTSFTSPGFDPLNDDKALERTFDQGVYTSLITLEDDLGLFFNHALTRDALVGVQAGEKSGKTYLELQIAYWALAQRRKVAVFEVGDLSESQLLLRLYGLWAGMPIREEQCGSVFVPTRVKFDDVLDAGYELRGRTISCPRVLTNEDARKGREAFKRAHGLGKKPFILNSVHPSGSINVRGISAILDQWEQERSFVPDVIIIDYADILAPEDPKAEFRHRVNDTWKALRALSQQRRALVVTATQSNADVYKQGESQRLQTQGNFSEDKRKFAHVTAMLGINRTWEEAEFGGMRLNWLVVREAPFNVKRPLYVGSCLALGRSICCASFKEIRKKDS